MCISHKKNVSRKARMADADAPEDDEPPGFVIDRPGFYQLTLKTRTLRYGNGDVVPEQNMTPFNLQAFACVDERTHEVIIRPRGTYGQTINPDDVFSAVYLHDSLVRFVLQDTQDPNARLAGEDFVVNVYRNLNGNAEHIRVPGLFDFIRRELDMRCDRNRLLQEIAPEFPPLVLPAAEERTAISWYTGPGVYRVIEPGNNVPNEMYDKTTIDSHEYNRYFFVLPFEYVPGRPRLCIVTRFWRFRGSQTTSDPIGPVSGFAKTAEKRPDLDLNWFLLDPIPYDDRAICTRVESWFDIALRLPEWNATGQAMNRFLRGFTKDNRYTRLLQRLIFARYGSDTASLRHAALKELARQHQNGNLDKRMLHPSVKRALTEYTSVRFFV